MTAVGQEIGTLSTLHRLDISGNKLLTLPPEIGHCTNLRILQLKTNELSTLPAELGRCTLLEKLDLAHNMITQLPVEMGQLTNLKLLDLEYNSLIFPPRKKVAEGTEAILAFLRAMQADRDKSKGGPPKSPRK